MYINKEGLCFESVLIAIIIMLIVVGFISFGELNIFILILPAFLSIFAICFLPMIFKKP